MGGAAGPSSSAAAEGEEPDPDDVLPRVVPLDEAKEAAAALVSFLGDQGPVFSAADKLAMSRIAERVQRMPAANLGRARQVSITNFLAPQ